MESSSNIETAPKSCYASRHDSIGGSCGGFGGAFICRHVVLFCEWMGLWKTWWGGVEKDGKIAKKTIAAK